MKAKTAQFSLYFNINLSFFAFPYVKVSRMTSSRSFLPIVSHQLSIKNVKLTSLKWNTVLFCARDAAKRDALAYKMHLVIPLATGMEKVHWVKWEQIAFILYLESYSRHWLTDAPSQNSFLHICSRMRNLFSGSSWGKQYFSFFF